MGSPGHRNIGTVTWMDVDHTKGRSRTALRMNRRRRRGNMAVVLVA
jgi:hypothetical protein